MPFKIECHRISRQSKYKIFFQYHKEVVDRIKEINIDLRKWDSIDKCWILHTKALFELIKRYRNSDKIFFDFGDNESKAKFIEQIKKIEADEIEKVRTIKLLAKKKEQWVKSKDELERDFEKYRDVTHKNLKEGVNLYPYQIAGTMFIDNVKNVLLALEMGLGKTLSSIAYVEMNNFDKVFVITPNSLKFNFYGEVEKFTNSKAHIIVPKASKYKNKYTVEESKYVIANYEYFNPKDKKKMDTKFKDLKINKIDVLICDEAQALKNTGSNTYKNFKRIFSEKIFKNEESKVFLSGTPAPNRAHELYSVLNQISSIDFATKKYFNEYYCGMTYDKYGFGWVTDNANQKLEELFNKIAPYTYRKKKVDVLTDLPDKIYQRIILEMNNVESKIYADIEEDVVNEIHAQPANMALTIMLRLRQYTSSIKINYVKEMIDNILEQGEKVVVVDMFKPSLIELHGLYPEISELHTGDQTVEDRATSVVKFQDPDSDTKIFFASIQTANYGLTLTEASKMIIITLPFSVGQYDQVADRCILKGELVLTKKEGYIPIENVKIDDLVYTHKGNWKRVINTKNKIERGKIFCDIKYKGFYKPLRCTFDHKIHVYNKKNDDYEWIEGGNIDIYNHYMVFPKTEISNYNNEFVVQEYKSNTHNKVDINKDVYINNTALLYAFGRYVGDGHVNDHQVSICGHINEYSEVLFCIETLKNVFGIKNHTEYKRENKIEMYISSIELKYNFELWFNSGAKNKIIPDFIYHLDDVLIKSFLNGYYDADGYKRKNTQQASTVSKYLSYQLIQLEGILLNKPMLRYNESASCWSFEYSINDKVKRETLIKNNDGNILYPISEIKKYKPKRNDERVYDLEVEDDSSFIVGMSSVHNCHRIGQKDTVNIYPLIFNDTLDQYVFDVIESKRKEIVKALDNEDYESDVSESVLSDVLNKLKNKYK